MTASVAADGGHHQALQPLPPAKTSAPGPVSPERWRPFLGQATELGNLPTVVLIFDAVSDVPGRKLSVEAMKDLQAATAWRDFILPVVPHNPASSVLQLQNGRVLTGRDRVDPEQAVWPRAWMSRALSHGGTD